MLNYDADRVGSTSCPGARCDRVKFTYRIIVVPVRGREWDPPSNRRLEAEIQVRCSVLL